MRAHGALCQIRRNARVEGLSIRGLEKRIKSAETQPGRHLSDPLTSARKTPVRPSPRLAPFKTIRFSTLKALHEGLEPGRRPIPPLADLRGRFSPVGWTRRYLSIRYDARFADWREECGVDLGAVHRGIPLPRGLLAHEKGRQRCVPGRRYRSLGGLPLRPAALTSPEHWGSTPPRVSRFQGSGTDTERPGSVPGGHGSTNPRKPLKEKQPNGYPTHLGTA